MDCQSMTSSHDDRRSATWICSSLSFATTLWARRKQKSWIQLWYTIMIRAIWSLQRKTVFQKDQSTLKSSITFSLMKSIKEKWFSNIYLHRWADSKHFGKASVQDDRVCVLKKQVEARGDNFLIKREEMTLRLGGSTDVLLIYGQSFFKFEKWSRMSSSLSSSESGLRFLTDRHFPVQKMVQIEWSFS